MKRALVLALIIILTCYCFFVGSSQAAEKKPMVLQYDYWLPAVVPDYKVVESYYKNLTEATGGAIKVQLNSGGAMGDPFGTYQRILQGIANIGKFNPGFNTGVFPLWEVFDYPIHCESSEKLARIQLALFEKGHFDKEFSKVKITGLYNIGSYVLFTNKKITSVEDFKGLKIRGMSEAWVEIAKAVGAVPVSLPTGEMFIAMQRGIVDAVAVIWEAALSFKLSEVSKYVNELYMTSSTHVEAWNKNSWDSLPKEAKDYIEANWKEYSLNCAKAYDKINPFAKKKFIEAGGEVVNFKPGEMEKLSSLCSPIWKKWLTDREAKGLAAKSLLDDFYKSMNEANIENGIPGYTP